MKNHCVAVFVLIVSWVVLGCDSTDRPTVSADPPEKSSQAGPDKTASESPSPKDEANSLSAAADGNPRKEEPGPASTTATPSVSTPPKPQAAPPSEEQLARWTPPSFEPLQLLAIQEWEKTSFTHRLAPLPDGQHFLIVGSRALLWKLNAAEPEHVFFDLTSGETDDHFTSLAVAPDGSWFAAGDSTGTLRIWGLADRQERITKKLDESGLQHIAVAPDGSQLATIAYDNVVRLWTVDKLEPVKSFDVDQGVKRIEFVGPDLLAVAGQTMTLWNVGTGSKSHDLPAGRYNVSLARTADGTRMLFGNDTALSVWDIGAGKPTTTIRGVGQNAILSVSSDDKTLATSDGHSIALWNLADGRHLQTIPGFGWTVVDIRWVPGTHLLAIASEVGMTRIWGTPGQGEAVGLKPIDFAVAAVADAQTPPSPEQLDQILDWRTFPQIPQSESGVYAGSVLRSTAPVSVAEAKSFYHYFLTKAGWTELPADANNPAAMKFQKDGATASGFFYEAGDGNTSVTFHNGGSFDVRRVPKTDVAVPEVVFEDALSSTYRVKSSISAIETSLLRKLNDAGWTPYARINTSYREDPNRRDLHFLRNGTTLRVSISRLPETMEPVCMVQQTLSSNDTWAPVPPDAGFVEFDGTTEPRLIAISKLSLAEATEFYDRELAAHGWQARPLGRSLKEEQCWLPYLRGQCDLRVGLTKLPNGTTLVRIGEAVGSIWEGSQKKEEETEKSEPGLQAADFPLVNSTKTGKRDAVGKTIEVTFEGSTLAAAAETYTKALGELGWEAAAGGIREEDYTFFDFKKEGKTITLRARKQDGAAVVMFEGNGLLWTKELPSEGAPVSYETWLRLRKLPPGLETLDQFEAEMKSIAP